MFQNKFQISVFCHMIITTVDDYCYKILQIVKTVVSDYVKIVIDIYGFK